MKAEDTNLKAYEDLIRRLVDRRIMLDMSQNEVVARIGLKAITQTRLSKFERLEWLASPHVLVRWAKALRMTIRFGVYLDCPEYDEGFFAEITPEY